MLCFVVPVRGSAFDGGRVGVKVRVDVRTVTGKLAV